MLFPTTYQEIFERVQQIDPVAYSKTRNFLDGAVTRLAPYISRGVISLSMIKEVILKKFNRNQSEKLLQELAWREYWQRIWETKGEAIFDDLKQAQENVENNDISKVILNASSGIIAIDESIRTLYETGYMHNHCRMYVASIICNIAKTRWVSPSRWMYYHLLDGDLASNTLSWQWVAGTFSSKKYYCNQENINKYCYTNQKNTFLDTEYDILPNMKTPFPLQARVPLHLKTQLPPFSIPSIHPHKPTLIYNAYNLDPHWHKEKNANRILLLEPSHYTHYPVSEKVIDFIIALSKNIPDLQIFAGNFEDLIKHTGNSKIIFKQHPSSVHYRGESESCTRMFPLISGYHSSFFSYWKKCEKYL